MSSEINYVTKLRTPHPILNIDELFQELILV